MIGRRWGVVVVAGCVAGCGAFSPSVGAECSSDPAACAAPSDAGVADAADGQVSFANDLRPIMNRSSSDPAGPGCADCHYSTAASPIGIEVGGLDMTTLGQMRKGGKTSGTNIIIPGNPDGSALIQKLRGTYPYGARMPYSGPPYLTDAEIQLFADWISQGAVGADDE
jgi:hypothetical protein